MADDLTLERLKVSLHYSPDTGHFTRLTSKGNGVAGQISASKDTHGYIQVRAGGSRYRAHRLAWFYMTGSWPTEQIDHINGVRDDNRWANLRQATQSQNIINGRLRSSTSTGFKGVTRDSDGRNRWRARITVAGRQRFLGYFGSAEEAAAAYQKAADEAFGQFARFS